MILKKIQKSHFKFPVILLFLNILEFIYDAHFCEGIHALYKAIFENYLDIVQFILSARCMQFIQINHIQLRLL